MCEIRFLSFGPSLHFSQTKLSPMDDPQRAFFIPSCKETPPYFLFSRPSPDEKRKPVGWIWYKDLWHEFLIPAVLPALAPNGLPATNPHGIFLTPHRKDITAHGIRRGRPF